MNESSKVLKMHHLSLRNGELWDISVFYENDISNQLSDTSPDAVENEIPITQIISVMWNDLDVTKLISESEKKQVEDEFKMQLPLQLEIYW